MKVLHVLASNSFSGAENVVCQIINMFSGEDGFEMAYASPDGPIRETLKEKDIKFYPLKKLSKKELKKAIKDFNPDILHAHDFRASVITGFSTRKHIISQLHNNPPWIKKKCIYSKVYAYSCKNYKNILTVSDSIINEYVYGYKYKDKVINIGNPIYTEYIKEKAGVVPATKKYDICFCGRLTEQKNPLKFIEIVKKLSSFFEDLKVIMLGDGELYEVVNSKIIAYGLNKTITLCGFVQNPYTFMNESKVFCLPSDWEGFGLVAIEAMTLGVPVVCGKVGGLVNSVDDSCGKLCTETGEYVEEIKKLLSDGDYLKQKSVNAAKKAEALSENNYFDRLKAIYSDYAI